MHDKGKQTLDTFISKKVEHFLKLQEGREDINETGDEPITLQERFYSDSVLIKEGPPSYLEALTSPLFLDPPENSVFFQNSNLILSGDTTDTLLQNNDSVSLQMSEYDDTELPPYEDLIGINSPLPSSRVTIAINGVPLDNDVNDSVGHMPNETLFVTSTNNAINSDDVQIESENNNMSIDPEPAIVTATPAIATGILTNTSVVTDATCNNEFTSTNDNVMFNEGPTLNSNITSDNSLNYEVIDVNSTNNIGNTSTTNDIALNEESITVDTGTITTAQPITTITRAARRSMLVSTSCEDILQTSSETSFPSSSIVEMTLTEVDSVISCDNIPSTAVVSHYECVVSS